LIKCPEEHVPIAGTHRNVWPDSTFAAEMTSDADVWLTAWLRPKRGGDLDIAQARRLGATPPLRRTYVSREELAKQTAADPADVELLRRYCARFNIAIVQSHWRSVVMSGPIDKLVQAFGATVAIFADASGRHFRHRSKALHVPPEIAAILRGVFGFHQWPRSKKLGSLQRHMTPLSAREIVARYGFPDGDGSNQTVGILQFRGEFKAADFQRCMESQGVDAALPLVKRVDNAAVAHEIETTKDLEAALDAQIIGSLASGARIVVYEAPDDERGFLDAIRTATFDEELRPSVLSISYGWPEHLWTPVALELLNELFTVAALLGVTVLCSSGDHGAELDYDGNPHVVAPASSPFAHSCGGTVLSGEDEVAWEQTGGGFSSHFEPPPWQMAAKSIAAACNAAAGRGVPDVAAQVQPGHRVFLDGCELAMGGTSSVAPLWAALTARINQQLGAPVGFFVPFLYQNTSGKLFRGVTSGTNGKYQACAGWNPCGGLGVPVGTAIEESLRET